MTILSCEGEPGLPWGEETLFRECFGDVRESGGVVLWSRRGPDLHHLVALPHSNLLHPLPTSRKRF